MNFFDGSNGNDGNSCFYARELIRGMVKGRGSLGSGTEMIL